MEGTGSQGKSVRESQFGFESEVEKGKMEEQIAERISGRLRARQSLETLCPRLTLNPHLWGRHWCQRGFLRRRVRLPAR